MKDIYILGIESSCDETSASIIRNGTDEISTIILSQIDIHTQFGGVVPEIASRHHIKNITMVIESCLNKANMSMNDIDAIAVTYGPGLIGSLLVGLEAAKTLAACGIKSYIFDSLRPTPQLSFAIRYLGCIAGIVITASHNPKEYNGYKVYWSDGGQVCPNIAEDIIKEVDLIEDYSKIPTISYEDAILSNLITISDNIFKVS